MSGRLPAASGAEVIKALGKVAFGVAGVHDSHHVLGHPDGRTTVVPVHAGETIGSGLLRTILRDRALDRKQFRNLLG